jgi:hypothetical protein
VSIVKPVASCPSRRGSSLSRALATQVLELKLTQVCGVGDVGVDHLRLPLVAVAYTLFADIPRRAFWRKSAGGVVGPVPRLHTMLVEWLCSIPSGVCARSNERREKCWDAASNVKRLRGYTRWSRAVTLS